MLNRKMDFVYKIGDLGLDTADTTKRFVGGSPVVVNSTGNVSGNVSQFTYNGVAYHSYDLNDALEDLVTYFKAPGIFNLEEGTETTTHGTEYADACAPWDESVSDFVVGNLLRPTTQTVGSNTYACWTNVVYTGQTSGHQTVYPAKIRALTGSGSSVTAMEIEIGTFTKAAA